MRRRPLTPGYIFFFILFLPDTWQVIVGVAAAWLLTPLILSAGMKQAAVILLYIMVATIGYAAARGPARGLTTLLKRLILGQNRPD